ncbi:MAG: phenylalanine--tRNA ligase subunit beta [Candidatus Saccharimonadales bacterium]
MLVVLDWLEEYLNDKPGLDQVIEAMDKAGVEVEGVYRPPNFDTNIVVAEVLEVKPHSDADKLKIATVSDGNNKYSIVCGAPNVAKNQHVVLARKDSVLPDGNKIEKTTIRGEVSEGMLCSPKELNLGEYHSGIMIFNEDINLGTPIRGLFNSDYTVIDIKTAANRPDLQGYKGLAIEIAAHTGVDTIMDEDSPLSIREDDDLFTIETEESVQSYSLIKLKINASKSSPTWMQRRLRLSGIKTINAVVDITNYCMLSLGQPMHAFDTNKIKDRIHVRFAQKDEKLTTLDGINRSLTVEDLVIADNSKPIGLAGVIGGEESEITEETKEILLESATFDASTVRKTAQRHTVRTDASARFERGLPTQLVIQANELACKLMVEYADAELVSHKHQLNIWPWVRHIGLRVSRFQDISSLDLKKEEIVAELKKLHFDASVFDIVKEARKHLGKSYKIGANFKKDGVEAFDCSYLVDYIYSLIGVNVGHTALGQYELGRVVEGELIPGDVLFIEGVIDKSATDHYYISDSNGNKIKRQLDSDKKVGHNGIYIGGDKVITAAEYIYSDGKWEKRASSGVLEVDVSEFLNNPGYLGARRYVDNLNDYISATVPWWRPDVNIEADLFEEVVKTIGLDKLDATLPKWNVNIDTPDNYWRRFRLIRHLLRAMGLFEVTTYPFISPRVVELFNLQDYDHLKLKNPRSKEQSFLRRSLVPQMLLSVHDNQSYRHEFGFFEIAKTFTPSDKRGELPQEIPMLTVVYTGDKALSRVKNCLDQLIKEVGGSINLSPSSDIPFLHPSRRSRLEQGELYIGDYGSIHPDINHHLKLSKDSAALEIDLNALFAIWTDPRFEPIPKYQSGYRDLTLAIPEGLSWQDLNSYLSSIKDIKSSFKDYFSKDGVKKITIHVELISKDKTLKDSDIASKINEIEQGLKRDLNIIVEH